MTKKTKSRKRGGASIPCPQCKKDSHVVVTRRVGEAVRRQRKCNARTCKHQFETVETYG